MISTTCHTQAHDIQLMYNACIEYVCLPIAVRTLECYTR